MRWLLTCLRDHVSRNYPLQTLESYINPCVADWDGREPYDHLPKPMIALRQSREHTRRRRPWNRAFSMAALKSYEDIIIKRSLQLAETLSRQSGVVDMGQWISYFS